MARNKLKIPERNKFERKQERRTPYDRILIVCEGRKTEPFYFKEIRATYRLHTASVEIRPSQLGTAPLQVVEYARDLFTKGDHHKKILPRAFDQIFAVFDRDDHDSYFNALNLSKSLDKKLFNDLKEKVRFQAIASVPCFELWLLLHFMDIQYIMSRHDVLRCLKKEEHIPDYQKGKEGIFSLTRNNFAKAYGRASVLEKLHSPYDGKEPYTGVHKLVNLLSTLRV